MLTITSELQEDPMANVAKLPARLHHTAYVTKDQEKTRHFYEDVIGLPLVATWCESDELFGKMRSYVHTFYGIGAGGALPFFQFADPADQAEFGPKMPHSPFQHIALSVDQPTQAGIEERIRKAGITPPQTYVLEHADVATIAKDRKADGDGELKRWLAGDHHTNNNYRS